MGDWEIVRAKAGDPWELYNLKTDPGETKNVADKNPDVIAKFEKLLKERLSPFTCRRDDVPLYGSSSDNAAADLAVQSHRTPDAT